MLLEVLAKNSFKISLLSLGKMFIRLTLYLCIAVQRNKINVMRQKMRSIWAFKEPFTAEFFLVPLLGSVFLTEYKIIQSFIQDKVFSKTETQKLRKGSDFA